MVTSIVFSRDRALQLDLALKTIKQNFELCDRIVVIYKASEQQYQESYGSLKEEHPDVSFYEQSGSLFFDIMATINGAKSDYICFFTDDNIVYNKVDINRAQLDSVFNLVDGSGKHVGCACLSLRLGLNTTKRDMGSGLVDDAIPQLFSMPPFFVWGFTGVPPGGYWAYPLSVDGHIFKRETILEFCVELEFLSRHYEYKGVPRAKYCWKQTPNEFESKLQRFYFSVPNAMAALEQSCVVNTPNNKVQEQMPNSFGESFNYTAPELNNHYLSGRRLDINGINCANIICPHQELDILRGLS